MFNSTEINNSKAITNEVTFNSVAGTIVKSTQDSKIIQFKAESSEARMFFDPVKPHRSEKRSITSSDYLRTTELSYRVPISVLQVMLCGNGIYLVEYIDIGEAE